MSLRVGIVGLPNVGKSTLFNALLKKRVALSANYPFATVEPNIGVVAVPDSRLEVLADLVAKSTSGESKLTPEVYARPPIVPAVVEFVDIAGLVKGAAEGAGLGNQFLSLIREVDAIIHVLRDFSDPNIIREGSENPDSDKVTIETELALADLQVVDKLIDNLKKEPKLRNSEKMVPILEEVKKNLEEGKIPGKYDIGDEQLEKWFKTLPLLSIKPVLYVYNVAESGYADKLRDPSLITQDDTMVISAKLEEELADLTEEERLEYLKSVGLGETGLERLIKVAYKLLGLISFLTAGKKEVRAWTIKSGTNAKEASGVIHTDFIRNFIRAQVIEYNKLIEAGSYAEAKQKGLIRTEGKEYILQDGDVVEFLVSS